MARMIERLKNVFSEPLLVWNPELKLSPNAPPRPAADCWIKIEAMRSTDNAICMCGRYGVIVSNIRYKLTFINKKANIVFSG